MGSRCLLEVGVDLLDQNRFGLSPPVSNDLGIPPSTTTVYLGRAVEVEFRGAVRIYLDVGNA